MAVLAGRQGARPGEELDSLLAAVRDLRAKVSGLFTHLCSSEVAQSAVTALQKRKFETAVAADQTNYCVIAQNGNWFAYKLGPGGTILTTSSAASVCTQTS